MSVTELKSDLHQLIDQIEDEGVLSIVHTFLSNPSFHWDDLPEATKASIQRSRADIKAGRVKDAWEALQKYQKYL